ncbi:DUF2269 domain-containing protein [Spirilliplanes yamanashiensis]|uniref:DUF2269 domain-containing protein n=1 Tax=Spirilliplanes yamanashiensis TaxID=42233 RepID=A0A8J3YE87_9ACTN|nr:DUF2269 domain-containing protein [Spirilliplanes yamanashiensis]MDP9816772.1 hypothetical protein [Spirilliplanes yamanashiensis]GIJ06294.1 hypothetical protein Sya03_56460 [Spirilliplanes yamanashiensis]
MTVLRPGARRAALVLHVSTSVGWFGAVLMFLVLAVTALRSRDDAVLRAAHLAMDVTARLVIVPLAAASLASGLVSSLGTSWGLLRHWWVLIKFALVLVATAVLLLQLGPIGTLADAAARGALTELPQARLSAVVHAAGGLLVLLAATVLAVYKPRGLTRYGWRRTTGAPGPT